MGFGPNHCAASPAWADFETHHNRPKQKKRKKEKGSFALGTLN
jgi:hypothetical protein